MTNTAQQHNIGAFIAPKIALAPVTILCTASANENVFQNGIAIDRQKLAHPESMAAVVAVKATLAAHKTVTVKRKVEDSADGATGWAAYGTAPSNTVLGSTGSTAAQSISTEVVDAIDLGGARRFVRCDVALDHSATVTDTSTMAAVAVFGGRDRN